MLILFMTIIHISCLRCPETQNSVFLKLTNKIEKFLCGCLLLVSLSVRTLLYILVFSCNFYRLVRFNIECFLFKMKCIAFTRICDVMILATQLN